MVAYTAQCHVLNYDIPCYICKENMYKKKKKKIIVVNNTHSFLTKNNFCKKCVVCSAKYNNEFEFIFNRQIKFPADWLK